jgi:hypothetical protein
MIDHAILLLKNELETFIRLKNDPVIVTIDNIGLFETSKGDTLTDSVVITVVNIEEESTLKNQPALRRPIGASAIYQNPPVYLNLYVLFTCNYSGDDYLFALKRLSYVIRFLQSKNSFSISSSVTGGAIVPDEPDVLELKFTMELYTLTFEQINHLWGSLGGRQMPFVMYKLRLVAISDRSILRQVPVIEEIGTELVRMD